MTFEESGSELAVKVREEAYRETALGRKYIIWFIIVAVFAVQYKTCEAVYDARDQVEQMREELRSMERSVDRTGSSVDDLTQKVEDLESKLSDVESEVEDKCR
jgi:uncharacterized protein YlxW (UPF0749 family)